MTPRELSEAVLSKLPKGEPVYAVLDGARHPRVRGLINQSRAPAWCLYRGPISPDLEDAAPWLVRLALGTPHTDELFARGWFDSWGIVLSSAAPSRELRRHLRRFLLTKTLDGRTLAFRYYDPRVCRVWLPSCTREEYGDVLGPLGALVTPGADGQTQVFTRQGPTPARRNALMVLREEQLNALRAVPEQAFVERMAAELARRFPGRVLALPHEVRIERVQEALSRGRSHGLSSERDLARFIQLSCALGFAWDAPEHAFLEVALRDVSLGTPSTRLEHAMRGGLLFLRRQEGRS